MENQWAVRTRDLCKAYHGRSVVDHLNLHVPHGCVYGFLGPNGAGKSTSMKMMLGLARPTSGSVELLGRKLDEESRREYTDIIAEESERLSKRARLGPQQRLINKRHAQVGFALLEELIGKTRIILTGKGGKERIPGKTRLNEHPPSGTRPTRSSRHLHESCEQVFSRPRHGAQNLSIGIQNQHESYVLKVVPLGNHLRSDEQIDLPAMDFGEGFFRFTLSRHAVAVDAQNPFPRERLSELLFNALRPRATRQNIHVAASRACIGHGPTPAAMVTYQTALKLVKDREGRATRTGPHPAARAATQNGRVSPTIHEKDDLSPFCEYRIDGLARGGREGRTTTAFGRGDEFDRGQLGLRGGAVLEFEQSIVALFDFHPGFERRRGRS